MRDAFESLLTAVIRVPDDAGASCCCIALQAAKSAVEKKITELKGHASSVSAKLQSADAVIAALLEKKRMLIETKRAVGRHESDKTSGTWGSWGCSLLPPPVISLSTVGKRVPAHTHQSHSSAAPDRIGQKHRPAQEVAWSRILQTRR